MRSEIFQYIRFLSSHPLFKRISPEKLLAILDAANARIKSYSKGETIVDYGGTVERLYIVLEGIVAAETGSSEGDPLNMNMLYPGDDIGLFLILSGNHRSSMRVYAGEKCKVLLLNTSTVQQMLGASPEGIQLLENMLSIVSAKCVDLYWKVQIYGQKRIRSRVRLYLMTQPRTKDNEVILTLNRTGLAAYLGVDRTALARELKRMEDEGLIALNRRRIKLLNLEFFHPSNR